MIPSPQKNVTPKTYTKFYIIWEFDIEQDLFAQEKLKLTPSFIDELYSTKEGTIYLNDILSNFYNVPNALSFPVEDFREDRIADHLSDEYGWLVTDFYFYNYNQ